MNQKKQSDWIKKQYPTICCPQEAHINFKKTNGGGGGGGGS